MVQLDAYDNTVSYTYGGVDQDGDTIIYVDSNAVTEPTPIICEFQGGRDFLTDLYWDAEAATWVIEHGAQTGQLK